MNMNPAHSTIDCDMQDVTPKQATEAIGVRASFTKNLDEVSSTVLSQVRNGKVCEAHHTDRHNRPVKQTDLENGEAGRGDCDSKAKSTAEDEFNPVKPSGKDGDPIAGYSHQHLHMIDTKPALRKQVLATMVMSLSQMTIGVVVMFSGISLPQLTSPDNGDLFLPPSQAALFGSLAFLGGIVGALASGPLMVRLGRRVTALLTLPISVAAWIILSFSPNALVLLFSRFFMGLTNGCVNPASNAYVPEISHKSLRGKFFGMIILMKQLGSVIVAALGLLKIDWRYMGFICCVVPALGFLGLLFLPNSPRWLVTRGRVSEARESLVYFRGEHFDVEPELEAIRQQVEGKNKTKTNFWQQLKQIFEPLNLRRFCLVATMITLFGFSGNHVIITYFVPIFQATQSSVDPYTSALICMTIIPVGCFVELNLVDKMGRRILLIISFAVCSICMAIFGVYFYVLEHGSVANIGWLPLTSVLMFVVFASIGQPVLFILQGELLPTTCRSIGVSLYITLFMLATFVSSTTYPYMAEALSKHGTFWVYSCCCAAIVLLSYTTLPETRGRSLEEITGSQNQQASDKNDNSATTETVPEKQTDE